LQLRSPPEEFDPFLAIMSREYHSRVAAGREPLAVIVWAISQNLSVRERQLLVKEVPPPNDGPPMRMALLTADVLLRGTLNVLRFLEPELHGVLPEMLRMTGNDVALLGG
jgi:hypothetical protein